MALGASRGKIGSAMCGCSTSARFTFLFFLSFFSRSVFYFISIFKNIAKIPAPPFFLLLTPAVEIRDGGEPAQGTRAVYIKIFREISSFFYFG